MGSDTKFSILGYSLTIPVTNGKLNLRTWQGILGSICTMVKIEK